MNLVPLGRCYSRPLLDQRRERMLGGPGRQRVLLVLAPEAAKELRAQGGWKLEGARHQRGLGQEHRGQEHLGYLGPGN